MASVHPSSGPQPAGDSSSRGRKYQVKTRELSADYLEVGPEHEPRDLGLLEPASFRQLLERLAAFDPVSLVDADPQVVVTVKSGAFLIQPQGGKLIVRPLSALDQVFFKLTPAEIPPLLDGVPTPPPSSPSTLIGSAAAHAATVPGFAAAPLRPAKKSHLRGILIAVAAVVLVAVGATWMLRPETTTVAPTASRPPPAITPASTAVAANALDPIDAPLRVASLRERFAGTYATTGEAGERLLELRADGTFHYQEFGSDVAVTKHENGIYGFALRPGTQNLVLRAGNLGVVEIRGENALIVRELVFTRLSGTGK